MQRAAAGYGASLVSYTRVFFSPRLEHIFTFAVNNGFSLYLGRLRSVWMWIWGSVSSRLGAQAVVGLLDRSKRCHYDALKGYVHTGGAERMGCVVVNTQQRSLLM